MKKVLFELQLSLWIAFLNRTFERQSPTNLWRILRAWQYWRPLSNWYRNNCMRGREKRVNKLEKEIVPSTAKCKWERASKSAVCSCCLQEEPYFGIMRMQAAGMLVQILSKIERLCGKRRQKTIYLQTNMRRAKNIIDCHIISFFL